MKQYGQLAIPGLLPQRREDSLRRTEILPPQSSVNNVSWLYRLRLSFAQKPLVSGFYGYLLEKIIKMRFNRIFADEQRTSDLVIRRADTQLIQDLFFPMSKEG